MSEQAGDEASIATVKVDGGKFELTTKRLLVFKDSKTAAAVGNAGSTGGLIGGLIGGAIGGLLQHRAGSKPTGEFQLNIIKAVTAQPGKGGKGALLITFINGKEAPPIPDIPGVADFAAKINAQIAAMRQAVATAPATIAKPGTTLTLDIRNKALPGWQMLQNWPPAAFAGDPADVRLVIPAAITTECGYIRTKEELGDCTIRVVYRFPVLPRFAYLALRVRSRLEGKSFTLVRLNSKGEYFVGTGAPAGNQPWTRHEALVADPTQPNEARLEIAGATLRVFFNGQLAVTKDGLDGPTGRLVVFGGAEPKPAEIAINALSVQTA